MDVWFRNKLENYPSKLGKLGIFLALDLFSTCPSLKSCLSTQIKITVFKINMNRAIMSHKLVVLA